MRGTDLRLHSEQLCTGRFLALPAPRPLVEEPASSGTASSSWPGSRLTFLLGGPGACSKSSNEWSSVPWEDVDRDRVVR